MNELIEIPMLESFRLTPRPFQKVALLRIFPMTLAIQNPEFIF